jgi:hypothetical protein
MKTTDLKNQRAESPRRSFLKTARGLGVLGAAAALLARSKVAEAKVASPPPSSAAAESGYHETDHIRKYYAAARYF